MRLRSIAPLLLSAALSHAGVTDFKMQPGDGATPPPIRFTGKTYKDHQRDLAAYLKKRYPDFDPADPACKSILWWYSRWTHGRPGEFALSGKYHDIGVRYFNQCQDISIKLAAVEHLPDSFKAAWRRRYAVELIEMRMFHRTRDEVKWLSDIPANSTLVAAKDAVELRAALNKTYPGFDTLRPLLRKLRYDKLASVNPGLDADGYYSRTPPSELGEPMVHTTLDRRVYLYRFDASMPVLLPPASWFGEAALKLPMTDTESREIRPWQITMAMPVAGVLPEETPLHLFLVHKKKGPPNAWVTVPTVNNRPYPVILSSQPDHNPPNFHVKARCTVFARGTTHDVALDLKLSGTTHDVKGTYTGTRTTAGVPVKVAGSVAGKVTGMGPPCAGPAVNGSWPWLYGPLNSNSSDPHNHKLVDNIAKAKLAWVSADTIPCGRGPDTRGNPKCLPNTPLMGGWGSLVMAHQRIYMYYYVPSGTNYAWGADKEVAKPDTVKEHYRVNLIDADDVLHCFDATTGETLWRRTYRGQGLNWAGFNKAGPSPTPCIAVKSPARPGPSRLCALGSAGKVYCVNAETGATLWQSSIGRRARLMENHRKYLRGAKAIYGSRDDFSSALVPAGGAVILCDHVSTKGGDGHYRYEMSNGLLALDLQTGKRLWHRPERCNRAIRWHHKDKEYVLAAGRSVVMCLEPMTGKILWEAPGSAGGAIALPVMGDHFVCGFEGRLACYKITPEGATKLWSGQGAAPGVPPPLIHRGHVYTGSGGIGCIELTTGKGVRGAGSGGWGLMVATGGRILLAQDQGHVKGALTWIRAEPPKVATLGETWAVPLAGCYSAPLQPVMADGRLFVRFTDRLACYDLREANAVAGRPHLHSKQQQAAAAAAAAAKAARTVKPPKMDEMEDADLDLDL